MNRLTAVQLFTIFFGLSIAQAGFTAEQLAIPAPTAKNRTVEDKEQLERRLHSVETLIEKSSAAQQIDNNPNVEAVAYRDKARALRRQAVEAYEAQDYSKSSGLLNEAAKSLFAGARLAAPERITQEKKRRDFDFRMESVKALLAAQKRISSEKHLGTKAADISHKIESFLQQANDLAGAGKLDEARSRLDQALLVAKTEISGQRKGDTLVRSLNFANKEEEYHYETDRNDTHKMLLKVLIEEKVGATGVSSMTQLILDQAAQLRAEAETQAKNGDYEAGIKKLEDSTRELIRAIRSAGIYIPG
jgi:hypothetical protein